MSASIREHATFHHGGVHTAVVRERNAKDIGVHYYNGSGVGAVADHVGIQAVDGFFFADGLAGVDTALFRVRT
jgi:hypothetical protein